MQKIVYFDEESALDYIILKDNGKKVTENITKFNGNLEGKVSAELGDFLNEESQSKVISFIKKAIFNSNFGAGAKIDGDINKRYTTTLSNTVLTDYIKKANRDKKVKRFNKIKIELYPESMAYYRLYTPYMELINGANNYQGINLTNLDSVLANVKGYTEVITKSADKKIDVLRFNTNTFRNNYKLSDILKMNLEVYAVKVGQVKENKMKLENEIKIEEEILTAEEIFGKKSKDDILMDVYDVILAGVSNE